MKAERRHELQHNELADWVAVAVERIKPYSRAIVGVVVAAAVLLTTYVVLSGRAERKQSTAWTDYYLAVQGPPENVETDLEAVMREHEGVAAGLWAEVALADLKLGEGIKALFADKAAAKKNLAIAVEHYEAVIPEAEDPLLVARARFGLGRALESQGELEKAREAYAEVVEASGNIAYVSLAEARMKDLNRDATKDFYAWFAKQEPVAPPPTSGSLLPGAPGERMQFDSSLLNMPGNINLSGENLLKLPELEKGTGPLLQPPAETDSGKDAVEPAKETDAESAKDAAPDAGTDDAANESANPKPGDAKEEVKEGEPPSKVEPPASAKDDAGAKSDPSADDQSGGKTL